MESNKEDRKTSILHSSKTEIKDGKKKPDNDLNKKITFNVPKEGEGTGKTAISSKNVLVKDKKKDISKKGLFDNQNSIKEETNVRRRSEKSRTISLGGGRLDFNKLTTFKSCQKLNPNQRFRDYMEDFALIINSFGKDSTKNLYCIFDGHGGEAIAKCCVEHYPDILKRCLSENPFDIDLCLKQSFLMMEKEAKKLKITDIGCTATAVLISGKYLHCANVGDSACVLLTDKRAEQISVDDKATNPSEIERITKKGGFVEDDRVAGVLAVSRSIGDFNLKNKGLTCEPHLFSKMIDSSLRYCIIASDGVWDVISPEDALKLSEDVLDVDMFCDMIVEEAIKRGSEDNISCIVIELNKKVKNRKGSH